MSADIGRLSSEIRNQRAMVLNGIEMRRVHPSYGHTKTGLRHDYYILVGLLRAWHCVAGIDGNANAQAVAVKAFDFDLHDLCGKVNQS
jgi:hypothetical protein